MKCRTPKLLVSFFILAIILIIAVPSTGFAAKTTVSTVKAKNGKKQSKNVTVKYRKQMNRILEATQLYYSIRLNYICLFNYLFISSQMSAKPYFIGSTGILLLW